MAALQAAPPVPSGPEKMQELFSREAFEEMRRETEELGICARFFSVAPAQAKHCLYFPTSNGLRCGRRNCLG